MGITLKRDVDTALTGKKMTAHQFNGSCSVDNPDQSYTSSGASNMVNDKTWKDVCKKPKSAMLSKIKR